MAIGYRLSAPSDRATPIPYSLFPIPYSLFPGAADLPHAHRIEGDLRRELGERDHGQVREDRLDQAAYTDPETRRGHEWHRPSLGRVGAGQGAELAEEVRQDVRVHDPADDLSTTRAEERHQRGLELRSHGDRADAAGRIQVEARDDVGEGQAHALGE